MNKVHGCNFVQNKLDIPRWFFFIIGFSSSLGNQIAGRNEYCETRTEEMSCNAKGFRIGPGNHLCKLFGFVTCVMANSDSEKMLVVLSLALSGAYVENGWLLVTFLLSQNRSLVLLSIEDKNHSGCTVSSIIT